jgi:alpha-beta hydrolase superfamily lysophospholipase
MFAWHHVPPAVRRRHAAVVLCPPLGYEYMSAYPTWKSLADRLASVGFDTLRIDYDGTGNSAGDGLGAGRLDAWRRSVEDAIDEARRVAGAASVALVGLRAGALIALETAASRRDVDRLVLWNPFASGRAYLRELKAEIALARETDAAEDPTAAGMNVSGYLLIDDTVKTLEQWTLDRLQPRCDADVLIVDRDDRPISRTIETQLAQLGARVTKIPGDGTAGMLQLPHLSAIPDALLDRIVEWLCVSTPAAAGKSSTTQAPIGCDAWCNGGWQERALRFGAGNRLFGVLTTPEQPAADAPALILLNTAVEYHIGPHRMYVPHAREHATRGHVVLRFDLGGIGDSEPPTGGQRHESFPDHMLDDLREAIALVRRDAPARPVIVAGLCSGGWLAFDAARQGIGIDAFVAINPPLFFRDNAEGKEWASHGAQLERFQQSVWSPAKWISTLRHPRVGMNVMRVVMKTLRRHAAAALARVRRTPQPGTLAADLASIAARGIRGHFVFSRGDAGLAYLQLHASTSLARKNIRRLVARTVVDGAGHTFRPQAAQAVMRRLIDETAFPPAVTTLDSSLYPSRNTPLFHQVLDATPPSC